MNLHYVVMVINGQTMVIMVIETIATASGIDTILCCMFHCHGNCCTG